MNKVTKAILDLLEEEYFEYFPKEINQGLCDEFADKVVKIVPKAEMYWAEDWVEENNSKLPDTIGSWGHCFIVYKNKFYDSECPYGTKQFINLPFFKRLPLNIA